MATISSTTPSVPDLIAAHRAAIAEHDRVFELADWGKATQDEVAATLDMIDDALLALCAARPRSAGDQAKRAKHLERHLPDELEGRYLEGIEPFVAALI
jgi:hypothetical protein